MILIFYSHKGHTIKINVTVKQVVYFAILSNSLVALERLIILWYACHAEKDGEQGQGKKSLTYQLQLVCGLAGVAAFESLVGYE